MQRHIVVPRKDWQKTVEGQGLTFFGASDPKSGAYVPYWNEEACYEFTSAEIDKLEEAANKVHEICLEAAQVIIDRNLFKKMGITDYAAKLIVDSWNKDEEHLYGRFDFAYDGESAPKVLEYNADTPTSLLEAAAIQWHWLTDKYPQGRDQFNSIHEKLIEGWKGLNLRSPVYFTAKRGDDGNVANTEDYMNTEYLRDTAHQAGLETEFIELNDIGFDSANPRFVDMQERDIKTLFKLWPWEWFADSDNGRQIPNVDIRILEPAWKMLWSNKGLLPVLWEIAPNHPNLLPAYFDSPAKLGDRYVRKPLYGREGANVTIFDKGKPIAEGQDQEYGEEGFVYQQFHHVPAFEGKYNPVLGIWMVRGYACGMGIRESQKQITDNLSRFVPHYFEPEN